MIISKTMQAAMAARAQAHAEGLLQDQWASKFIDVLPDSYSTRDVLDRASHGLFSRSIVIRSRFFERSLQQWKDWAQELVCISGGMDLHLISKPAAESMRKMFFDLPSSLGLLKKTVMTVGGDSNSLGVEFCEVDLNQPSALADAWQQSGCSLILWEGASYYLPPEAIRNLIRQVGAGSKPVKLVFDCLCKDGYLVDGKPRNEGVARNLAFVAEMGEPWLGFVSRDELVTWAHEAGFGSIRIDDRAFVERELDGKQELAEGQMIFVTLEK